MSNVDLPVSDDVMFVKFRKKLARFAHSPSNDDNSLPPPAYDMAVAVESEKLNKMLESPEAQKSLKDAITELGDAAQKIETAFWDVSHGLAMAVSIANKGGQTERSKVLREYKDDWNGFRETYVELLWDSRRVAGSARAVALDFAGDFLDVIKDEEYSIKEKKEEIASYRKSLETGIADGANVSQRFADLHKEVKAFREKITKDTTNWVSDESKALENLQKEIEEVEIALERARKITVDAFSGAVVFASAGTVLATLGVICPLLFITSGALIVIGGRNAVLAHTKYNELLAKRSGLQEKQVDFQGSKKTAEEIKACTDGLVNDMSLVEKKLGAFAGIWSTVRSDLVHIEKDLEQATTSAGKKLFQKRIETISTAYRVLVHALRLYETNVYIGSK